MSSRKFAVNLSPTEVIELEDLMLGTPQPSGPDGIVCSWPWAQEAIAAMRAAKCDVRRQLPALYRALVMSGTYPPRDPKPRREKEPERKHAALMRACPECGRDCPPSIRQPIPKPGRTDGLCCDCVEDRKAPRDVSDEPMRQRGAYRGDAAAKEVLERFTFARTIALPDGGTETVRIEVTDRDDAGRARAFVRQQIELSREMARAEDDKHLQAEIERWRSGGEPSPAEMNQGLDDIYYKRRATRKRRR